MIINLEDCPFEFGERIYFYEEEKKYKTIPCPFCNGKQILHLDTECYSLGDYKNANLARERIRTNLSLKCRNCTDGTYTYCEDIKKRKKCGTIEYIYAYHSTGWKYFEFCIALDDGTHKMITGGQMRKIPADEISNDKILEKSPIVELIKATRAKIENNK